MSKTKKHTDVGGAPLIFTQTGASAATAVDISVACGFIPDVIVFIPNIAATNPDRLERVLGLADGAALLTTGSTGVVTIDAADAFEDGSDDVSFTICSEIQVNSATYSVFALRYRG